MITEMITTIKGQINKKAIITATIHFILSFFTDRFFFRYWPAEGMGGWARIILFKGLFLIVLLIMWHVIFSFVRRYREHSINKTWLHCSVGYFIFLFILTLCVWPGLWEWDEFSILSQNVTLHMHVWQSLLSNVIYIISLMILPFPTGIVIIQIILVSIIVGYVLLFLFSEFKCKTGGKVLLWIPFLLIPVLYFAQAPIRLGLYSFIELLFLTMLYKLCKYNEWSTSETILGVILVSVLATWRSEAIYYLVFAPVLIWIFMKNSRSRRQKTVITLAIIALTLLQYEVQSMGYHKSTSSNYELTAYVNPLQELVGYAATHDPDNADSRAMIDEVGRVFNTDIMINDYKEGIGGSATFFIRGNFIKQYDKTDLSSMKTAYIKLMIRYPNIFLKERFKNYINSNILMKSSVDLPTDDDPVIAEFRNHNLTAPISSQVRRNLVNLLELNSISLHKIMFNALIPCLILLFTIIICCIKHVWGYAAIISLSLIRVPILILTAPSPFFMYYFPIYLLGALILPYLVLKYHNSKQPVLPR